MSSTTPKSFVQLNLNYQKVRNLQKKSSEEATKNIREILSEINTSMGSKEIYDRFQKVRLNLTDHPSLAEELKSSAAHLSPKIELDSRKLSFIAGALAQTATEESEKALIDLLKGATDETAQIQYAAALGDFQKPSPETADLLWEIYQTSTTEPVRSCALLALGAVGSRLDNEASYHELSEALSSLYHKEENSGSNLSLVIAAMGNMGAREHREELLSALKSPDDSIRGATYYALREFEDEEVNLALLSAASLEKKESVISEALKPLLARLSDRKVVEGLTGLAKKSNSAGIRTTIIGSFRDHKELNLESITAALEQLDKR
jgi:HEAT repeat protein